MRNPAPFVDTSCFFDAVDTAGAGLLNDMIP